MSGHSQSYDNRQQRSRITHREKLMRDMQALIIEAEIDLDFLWPRHPIWFEATAIQLDK